MFAPNHRRRSPLATSLRAGGGVFVRFGISTNRRADERETETCKKSLKNHKTKAPVTEGGAPNSISARWASPTWFAPKRISALQSQRLNA
ncbi:MAG: hypothetical protein C5B50_21110 [Verrucomicrobia bacterium]|nr:MAG: hypothetical protein C5B50_21110 [Verrucomicrobiota bacterium]